MSDQLDRLGNPLSVGDKVLLLQIPVLREHEFIVGEILQFTDKKVKVRAYIRSRYSAGEMVVFRFKEQLIKVT